MPEPSGIQFVNESSATVSETTFEPPSTSIVSSPESRVLELRSPTKCVGRRRPPWGHEEARREEQRRSPGREWARIAAVGLGDHQRILPSLGKSSRK
jgi:hypothetical protein